MTCCAFGDCGNPACRVCEIGRQPQPREHALSRDPMREDAPPDLPAKRRVDPTTRKRHRDGPFRGWDRRPGARW